MIELTRRKLFAGAATAAAATALTSFTGHDASAAPPASKSTGVFSYKVGDYEIVALRDGSRTFPMPDNFVVNVSKDKAIEAATAAYIPNGQVTIPFSPMIVNTGSKLVAIDTGNGLGAFAGSKGAVGQTRGNMEAAGFDPKQIDIVLISHFHGDHIGGLKNADGSPAYPNAEIKVPAVEAAFWADDANQSKANGFNKGQFAGVLVLAAVAEGQVALAAAVSQDLTGKFQAGKIIQQIAPIVGGKGGGCPDNARGAGKDATQVAAALQAAEKILGS